MAPSPSARQSAPVNTPSTPGIAWAPRCIDAADARMRMGRAHHRRVGLAVRAEIVAEPALAGDQPLVLLAADGLADEAEVGGWRFLFEIGHRRQNSAFPPARERRRKDGSGRAREAPSFPLQMQIYVVCSRRVFFGERFASGIKSAAGLHRKTTWLQCTRQSRDFDAKKMVTAQVNEEAVATFVWANGGWKRRETIRTIGQTQTRSLRLPSLCPGWRIVGSEGCNVGPIPLEVKPV